MKLFRTTLDIDTNNKEIIERVFKKISKCKNLKEFYVKPSGFKGYHFILFCDKKCDVCRLCYDDSRRFAYDQNRPPFAQNILFNKIEEIEE